MQCSLFPAYPTRWLGKGAGIWKVVCKHPAGHNIHCCSFTSNEREEMVNRTQTLNDIKIGFTKIARKRSLFPSFVNA